MTVSLNFPIQHRSDVQVVDASGTRDLVSKATYDALAEQYGELRRVMALAHMMLSLYGDQAEQSALHYIREHTDLTYQDAVAIRDIVAEFGRASG